MTQEMQERELDWKQEKSRSFSHQSLTDLVRVYGVCGLIGREGEQKEESFPHIVKNLIREMEEQEVEACLPGRNQSVRRHQDPVRISGDQTPVSSLENRIRILVDGDGCQIAVSGKDAGIESQGCGTVIVTSGINTRIQSLGSRVQIGSSGEAVKIISSGEHAWIWSSGSDARISGEADFVQIRSSGEHVRIDNTGNFSRIISSGEDAWIKNSGYSCRMKSEGKRARITNFGENVWIECSGEGSIICGLGMGSFVKAARGSWITLAEWEYSREENRMILTQVKTGRVDNITLREGVYYTLKQGVFTEKRWDHGSRDVQEGEKQE